VATGVLFELHNTILLLASLGATVAVRVEVAPTDTMADVGDILTPVTATLVPTLFPKPKPST